MGEKRAYPTLIILFVLFLLVFGLRLYFSLSTPTLTGDESYFHLRQIENIKDTGLPIFEDELSYGGRTLVFLPLYDYILAISSFFSDSIITGKIITNLFASLIIFFVYSSAYALTKNFNASFFSATLSGFLPLYLRETVNSLTPLAFVFPLLVILITSFFYLENKKAAYTFIIVFIALTTIHYSAIIVLLAFLFYLLLIVLEGQKQNEREKEIILFSFFFFLWAYIILFKRAFLLHGFDIIWQNVPTEIIPLYFSTPSLIEILILLGTIPVFYGAYALFNYLLVVKDRKIYLIISFVFSASLLLVLKMIRPVLGILIIGVMATILSSKLYQRSLSYLKRTNFEKFLPLLNIIFVIAIILTAILPSIVSSYYAVQDSVPEDQIKSLEYLKKIGNESSLIVAPIKDGHIITALAGKPVLTDSNFMLIKDMERRFEATYEIFTTPFETRALEYLDEYNIKYIYFSIKAKENYGVEKIPYIDDYRCFDSIFRNDYAEIIKVGCSLE